jgi:hypothetical protein
MPAAPAAPAPTNSAPLPAGHPYRQPPIQPSPRPPAYAAPYRASQLPHRNAPLRPGNAVGAPGFTTLRPPTRPRRRPAWLIGAGALTIMAVAVAFVGFVVPGLFTDQKLDIAQAQAGVARVLTDPSGFGAKRVSDVTCNDGHDPVIHQGATFDCQATIDRVKQVFVVTFTDDAGSYQVGSPRQGTKI